MTSPTCRAETAADLMTPNPVSIRQSATVAEAVALLTRKGISAVPVIDEAGRPVGVLSQYDILVHDRYKSEACARPMEYFQAADLARPNARAAADIGAETRVRDIMTPAVFSVELDSPVRRVIEDLLALHVHRVFVVDASRALVGVISALDVLRKLQMP